ncbi:hypothetical protein ACLB2K_009223 [Fragaria x ananassa]
MGNRKRKHLKASKMEGGKREEDLEGSEMVEDLKASKMVEDLKASKMVEGVEGEERKRSEGFKDSRGEERRRSVGKSMINRFVTRGSLKMPFSSKRIAIVDGHVRLPNPSRTQPKYKMAIVSIIEQHKSKCLEFVNVKKSAASVDMNHLVKRLDYIISKIQEPMDHILLFKELLCHFTYRCSYGKLTFVEHSVRFLKKITNSVQGYKSYMQDIKYDIYATIWGNPVVQVYFYPHGKPPKDAAIEFWTKYENTSVGVLNFMINFIKHADEECDKLGLTHFTDEEKEAMPVITWL